MELDYEAMLNQLLNAAIVADNKELAPVMKVLNKYGISGFKALAFLMELADAVKGLDKPNNQ